MSFYDDLPRELAGLWPMETVLIPLSIRASITEAWNKMPESWKDELVAEISTKSEKLEQVKLAAVRSIYALLDYV